MMGGGFGAHGGGVVVRQAYFWCWLCVFVLGACGSDSASDPTLVGSSDTADTIGTTETDVDVTVDSVAVSDAAFGAKDTGIGSEDMALGRDGGIERVDIIGDVASLAETQDDAEPVDLYDPPGDTPDDSAEQDVVENPDDGVSDVGGLGDVQDVVDEPEVAEPTPDGVSDVVYVSDANTLEDVPETVESSDVVPAEDVVVVPCLNETTGCMAPVSYGPAAHLTILQVGKYGYAGESLDLDPENGPDDCAPIDYCDSGIDNALTSFGELSNSALKNLFASGDVILVVEAPDGLSMTDAFSLNGYVAKKAPGQGGCDIQNQVCEYTVSGESFGCMCEPVIHFDQAWLDSSGLLKTGEGTFSLAYPITQGVVIQITLYRARLVATAQLVEGTLVLTDGVVAGALRPEQLAAAIEAWPSDDFGGFSKSLILAFINGLLTDIDTDGDGNDDAVSIGLKLESVGAVIVPL